MVLFGPALHGPVASATRCIGVATANHLGQVWLEV